MLVMSGQRALTCVLNLVGRGWRGGASFQVEVYVIASVPQISTPTSPILVNLNYRGSWSGYHAGILCSKVQWQPRPYGRHRHIFNIASLTLELLKKRQQLEPLHLCLDSTMAPAPYRMKG